MSKKLISTELINNNKKLDCKQKLSYLDYNKIKLSNNCQTVDIYIDKYLSDVVNVYEVTGPNPFDLFQKIISTLLIFPMFGNEYWSHGVIHTYTDVKDNPKTLLDERIVVKVDDNLPATASSVKVSVPGLDRIAEFKTDQDGIANIDFSNLINSSNHQGDILVTYSCMDSSFSKLISSSNLIELISNQSSPADLVIKANFQNDQSLIKNGMLNAGDVGDVVLEVANNGKGTAFNTTVEIDSDNSTLSHVPKFDIGDIVMGEKKNVTVRVKAGIDTKSGTATFRIIAREKRGYDSKRLVMNLPIAKLEKPEIVVSGYRINDSTSGSANGNSNGIPENGETVEIITAVTNNGVGEALNVSLDVVDWPNDIELKNPKTITIPHIAPGETMTGIFVAQIPATYKYGNFVMKFNATDARGQGASTHHREFVVKMNINQPALAYKWRLVDKNGNEKSNLCNGDDAELVVTPLNKGSIGANNINIQLLSSDALLFKTSDFVKNINPKSEYAALRFPVSISRNYNKENARIAVNMTQKDFEGIKDDISIPVKIVSPNVKVVCSTSNGGTVLRQGESTQIVCTAENHGELAAENVSLELNIAQKGIVLRKEPKTHLGKIEAGRSVEARYPVDIQRGAVTGNLSFSINLTQDQFDVQKQQMAFTLSGDQDDVITIQASESRSPRINEKSGSRPPVIAVAQPRDNARTVNETITLSAVATAGNGIAAIDIHLNGKLYSGGGRGLVVREKLQGDATDRDISESIQLQPGKNEITITVYDYSNQSKTKNLVVYRESKKGEIYAAVIGINKYQTNGLSLKYAKNDAEAFADYLKTNLGLVSGKNLFELYDDHADAKSIRTLLRTTMRKKTTRPEDTVYIYFAGHGAPEQDIAA